VQAGFRVSWPLEILAALPYRAAASGPTKTPTLFEEMRIVTWQFRKSKTSGPFRFTFGKRGVSTSIGFGPFRISLGSDKKIRRTIRIPGTGLYETKVVDKDQ
jgi:Protein of unknown function (DUF4236)